MLLSARYSTQTLTRNTTGRIDRWHLVLQHRLAARYFENSRRVKVKPLEETFPGLSTARAVVQNAVTSPNWLANADAGELIVLSTICAYRQPRLVVEFGTFDGLTALHFAINSPADAQVVTVDLDPNDPFRRATTDDTFYSKGVEVGAYFKRAPEGHKVRQVFCNTLEFDTTPYEGKADMIFVDAGHAYELVRSDSLKAMEMIAPGGVILWHDYHYAHEGVFTWLNEMSEETPLFQIPNTKFVCHVAPGGAAHSQNNHS
jgi:predicted O-methyltransferase YrrM